MNKHVTWKEHLEYLRDLAWRPLIWILEIRLWWHNREGLKMWKESRQIDYILHGSSKCIHYHNGYCWKDWNSPNWVLKKRLLREIVGNFYETRKVKRCIGKRCKHYLYDPL